MSDFILLTAEFPSLAQGHRSYLLTELMEERSTEAVALKVNPVLQPQHYRDGPEASCIPGCTPDLPKQEVEVGPSDLCFLNSLSR